MVGRRKGGSFSFLRPFLPYFDVYLRVVASLVHFVGPDTAMWFIKMIHFYLFFSIFVFLVLSWYFVVIIIVVYIREYVILDLHEDRFANLLRK